MKCRLCGTETDMPCGPLHYEVCPSCWLAVDCNDFLCQAPSLEVALDFRDEQGMPEKGEDVEFYVGGILL
jgi:hypothetical protein